MSGYDAQYKSRIKAAVLKAIVKESLERAPDGRRTARVKLAEAFDAAVEALTMLSPNRRAPAEDAPEEARRLQALMAAAQTRLAASEPPG